MNEVHNLEAVGVRNLLKTIEEDGKRMDICTEGIEAQEESE